MDIRFFMGYKYDEIKIFREGKVQSWILSFLTYI